MPEIAEDPRINAGPMRWADVDKGARKPLGGQLTHVCVLGVDSRGQSLAVLGVEVVEDGPVGIGNIAVEDAESGLVGDLVAHTDGPLDSPQRSPGTDAGDECFPSSAHIM